MNGTSVQPSIFDDLRELRKLPSLDRNLCELLDLAIASITTGQDAQAVRILNQLKECVAAIKPQLDRHPEMLVDNAIQVKLLQKENCELNLALARLKKDDESIYVYEEMLTTFDQFFAAAIADLDSE